MIDYFFRWANVAEARQDALLYGRHIGVTNDSPGARQWLQDHVLPNVRAWRPSQDVSDGNSPPTITHTYLTGFMAIVSLDHVDNALLNADALAFALDRDLAKRRGESPRPQFVLKNNVGAIIADLAVEPIFAGSDYPIGGY
jgi:hypothetical protein